MWVGYGPMLELVHDNQRWTLWLTFVGRYAYFLKYMEGRNFKAILCNEDCTILEETNILAILKNLTPASSMKESPSVLCLPVCYDLFNNPINRSV
jgi:hypothetical protein